MGAVARSVAVIIPWRDGCPHRRMAMEYVCRWWGQRHPDWQLVLGEDAGTGPWRKGLAVWHGLQQTEAETVIVADADVIPAIEAVDTAVRQVHDSWQWAAPFRPVYRLSQRATTATIDTGRLPEGPFGRRSMPEPLVDIYARRQAAGGIVVLPAATARRVPMDPRFADWGQEDFAWQMALQSLAGAAWRSPDPLFHLWHPDAPRMSHGVGNAAGFQLWGRYRQAIHPILMTELVGQALAILEGGPATSGQLG